MPTPEDEEALLSALAEAEPELVYMDAATSSCFGERWGGNKGNPWRGKVGLRTRHTPEQQQRQAWARRGRQMPKIWSLFGALAGEKS